MSQSTQTQVVCHYSAAFEIKMSRITKNGKSKVVVVANEDDDDDDDHGSTDRADSARAILWLNKWYEISEAINASAAELDHANILLAPANDQRQKAQADYSQVKNAIDAQYELIMAGSKTYQDTRAITRCLRKWSKMYESLNEKYTDLQRANIELSRVTDIKYDAMKKYLKAEEMKVGLEPPPMRAFRNMELPQRVVGSGSPTAPPPPMIPYFSAPAPPPHPPPLPPSPPLSTLRPPPEPSLSSQSELPLVPVVAEKQVHQAIKKKKPKNSKRKKRPRRRRNGNFLYERHVTVLLAVIGVKEVLLKPWCKTYYLCKFANNKNVGEGFWRTCEFLR